LEKPSQWGGKIEQHGDHFAFQEQYNLCHIFSSTPICHLIPSCARSCSGGGYLVRVTVTAIHDSFSTERPREYTMRSVSKAWLKKKEDENRLKQKIEAILAQLRLFNWGNEGKVEGIAKLHYFFQVHSL